jgi:uncharacterized membrane protein
MEHTTLYYVVLVAGMALIPGITDRLVKDRVATWLRVALGILAAAFTPFILVLIARPLGW